MPTYDVFGSDPREERARRQMALAQALQAQAFQPIQPETSRLGPAPIHPLQGLAQLLKAYGGRRKEKRSQEEMQKLAEERRRELAFALGPQAGIKPNEPATRATRESISGVLGGSQTPAHQQMALQLRLGDIEAEEKMRLAEARRAQADATPSMGEKEYRYYLTLTPEQKQEYLAVKRAQQVLNLGGTQRIVDPRDPAGAPVAEFPVTPRPTETPEFRAKVTEAEKAAASRVEKEQKFPAAETALRLADAKWDFVEGKIDEAMGLVSEWTAGPAGALDWIPGSDPRQLAQVLTTIRANLGFEELSRMRAASPTGGALGQVSEMENRLLQAVQGSLDNLQKPSALRKNLEDIKFYNRALREEIRRSFRQDFKDFVPEDDEEKKSPSQSGWSIKKLP